MAQTCATSIWTVTDATTCNIVASGTVVPTTGQVPYTVTFTDTSTITDGTISSVVVDFGEGAPVTIPAGGTATYTYTTPGPKTITSSVSGVSA
jgi:PKD repeat protein